MRKQCGKGCAFECAAHAHWFGSWLDRWCHRRLSRGPPSLHHQPFLPECDCRTSRVRPAEKLSSKHTFECSYAHPAKSWPPFFVTGWRVRANDALLTSGKLRALSAATCEPLMSLRTFCVVSSEAADTLGEVSAETACLYSTLGSLSQRAWRLARVGASSSKVWEPVLSRVMESGRSNRWRFGSNGAQGVQRSRELGWLPLRLMGLEKTRGSRRGSLTGALGAR